MSDNLLANFRIATGRALARAALVAACAPLAQAQDPLFTTSGDSETEWLGFSLAGVGDVDGDGLPDLVAGAPRDATAAFGGGSVHVISGAGGAEIHVVTGPVIDGRLGHAVSAIGDVDKDGFQDYVVGAPRQGGSVGIENGVVLVISGANGSAIWSRFGPKDYGWLGYSLSAAGDVDQNGVPDLVAGAPGDGPAGAMGGRVMLLSGGGGWPIWNKPGLSPGDRFGFCVSGGADANGDGIPDVAIGIPGRSTAALYAGAIQVLDGATGALIREIPGAQAFDYCGEALDLAGDVDQDGLADVLIGLRARGDAAAPFRGEVQVVSNATGAILLSMAGQGAYEAYGAAVAYLGDTDGDGRDDFAAGGPWGGPGGLGSGVVRLVSAGGGAVALSYSGTQAKGLFGGALARVGDLDQDGVDELAVGARREWSTKFDEGRVYVFSRGCTDDAGYGTGCAGALGFVPALERGGCVAPGAQVELRITEGLGGSQAILLLGGGPGSAPMGGGCSLLVAPLLPFSIGPVPLSPGGPGEGAATLQTSLPAPLLPFQVALQAFVVDPAAPIGAAASNGVVVQFP